MLRTQESPMEMLSLSSDPRMSQMQQITLLKPQTKLESKWPHFVCCVSSIRQWRVHIFVFIHHDVSLIGCNNIIKEG